MQVLTLTAAEAAQLTATHENPHFLPGVALPPRSVSSPWATPTSPPRSSSCTPCPTQAVREVARWAAPRRAAGSLQLSLAKGYELGTLKRPTQVIEEETGSPAAALSGPNHAEEVSKDMPSATVIAAADETMALALQAAITSDTFRVYTNDDVVGVEFCGAVKNPIAVAVGMSDGLGFGDNSRASLITRSVAEMTRLGMIQGAHIATFTGLAGIGDLIATCTSRHSRNRLAGELLAKGASPAEVEPEVGQVVEGIPTAYALHDLAGRLGIEMPVTENVYQVLEGRRTPQECVADSWGAAQEGAARDRRGTTCGSPPLPPRRRDERRRVVARRGRLVDSPRPAPPLSRALRALSSARSRQTPAQPAPARLRARVAVLRRYGGEEEATCSRRSRSPKATPTSSPTRSRTPSSTRSSPRTPTAAWPARRWSPPASPSSPARSPPRRYVDIPKIVRQTVKDVGYTNALYGYDYETCGVMVAIDEQSPDISQGVSQALEVRTDVNDDDVLDAQGAGDQGMMFGFACTETPELMPLPISLAHKLARRLADVRKAEILPYLRPDGKSQVTVRYEDGKPVEIVKVVLASQHAESADLQSIIYPDLLEHVVEPILPKGLYDAAKLEDITVINATGKFVIGGPMGDCGLTGRKIVVDTYGGAAPHGGGAFSGKDPSKVDRSGAYAARYVAKNVVAAGLAERCELQVAYAIGVAHPVSRDGRLPGHREGRRSRPSSSSSASTSTCVRRPSFATSTCAGPSTRRRRPTAISAATTTTSRGSAPTRPTALRAAAGLKG